VRLQLLPAKGFPARSSTPVVRLAVYVVPAFSDADGVRLATLVTGS